MKICKTYKRAVGSHKPIKNAPIKGAQIVKDDSMAVERMNAICREKCKEQRRCDAMTEWLAGQFIAGD